MSRREDRSSDSKRRHSRFDREPSPKRSRRDGKPEAERPATEPEKDRSDRDRDRRRLQDPLPLEAHGSKVESGNMSKESEKGSDGHQRASRHSSDTTKVPPSRSYFHHDDRGSAGQNGRSFSRRTDSERGWWRDPKAKQQQSDRSIDKNMPSETNQKDEKSKDSRDTWRHDGYFEMEANPQPPIRKRPAFREQKIPSDPEKTNKTAADSVMTNPQQELTIDRGRRNERDHITRQFDRSERRPYLGGREPNKAQSSRGNFSSRDRYNANNTYRGRDRFTSGPGQGQGYRPTGPRVDKWKHDLYDEANKSPPPKNEEDQISKIEALLSS